MKHTPESSPWKAPTACKHGNQRGDTSTLTSNGKCRWCHREQNRRYYASHKTDIQKRRSKGPAMRPQHPHGTEPLFA